MLENATILPFEGQRDVHDLFVQCQICLAMEAMKKGRHDEALKRLEGSKEYPVRLGTGKPQDPDYRVQDYLMVFTYDKMGAPAKAEEAQKRIAEYSARNSRGGAETAQGPGGPVVLPPPSRRRTSCRRSGSWSPSCKAAGGERSDSLGNHPALHVGSGARL